MKNVHYYYIVLITALSMTIISNVTADTPTNYVLPNTFYNSSINSFSQKSINKPYNRSGKRLKKKQDQFGKRASIEQDLLNYFSLHYKQEENSASKQLAEFYQYLPIITKKQRNGFNLLREKTASKVEAEFDEHNGTITFLRGRFNLSIPLRKSKKITNTNNAKYIAKRFLTDNKSLLKLNSPDAEMKLIKQHKDNLGLQHVKFQQIYKGIPVFAKQLSIHIDTSGVPYLITGRYSPSIKSINPIPSVELEQAKDIIREQFSPENIQISTNKLVIYTKNNRPFLTYKIEVRKSLLEYWDYFIDAHNGKILDRISRIQYASASASANDELGSTRSFFVWEETGLYSMIDTVTMGGENHPFDNQGRLNQGNLYIFDAKHTEDETSTNDINEIEWYEVLNRQRNSGWDPTAVSAMTNTKIVFNYYKNKHNRHSLDNKNSSLISVIHVGNSYENAFWDGFSMNYGDGDNTFSSLARCLDVAAHEITHGLTQHTANLISRNQSGALNESFSDVFAAMIDDEDWLLGEDCTIASPGYLRNMETPSSGLDPQPSKMSEYKNLPVSQDRGGVHINSGIPNHAAYLTATSIGRPKTELIYYRALTLYLTQSSQFIDARRSLVQSAVDLYGEHSSEVTAVKKAWDSVEVVEGGIDDTSPTPTDPTNGIDKMYYLYKQEGALFLYEQTVEKNTEYDRSKDKQLTTLPASNVRPAPYTSSTGTGVFFVDSNNSIRAIDPEGNLSEPIGEGQVSTISISPDGRYFAFTTIDATDDNIYILDLEKEESQSYKVLLQDYNGKYIQTVMVRYADALSFDFSSKKIIFDMLVCTASISSSCNANDINSGINYWTVGILDLDLDSPEFISPFPAQDSNISLAYPTFSNNNNYVIALDVINSNVVTTDIIDFETQTKQSILTSSQLTIPSFWGDDDALTVLIPDEEQETIAVTVPINKNTWTKSGSQSVLNPFNVNLPIMHRAGKRVLISKVEINKSNLNFGDNKIGENKMMTVIVRNTGNHDIDITNIDIESDSGIFQIVQGTNTLLPRGAELTIGVIFKPLSAGTFIDSLSIDLNNNLSKLSVNLKGNGISIPKNENTSSGGGALDLISLLLLALYLFIITFIRWNEKS